MQAQPLMCEGKGILNLVFLCLFLGLFLIKNSTLSSFFFSSKCIFLNYFHKSKFGLVLFNVSETISETIWTLTYMKELFPRLSSEWACMPWALSPYTYGGTRNVIGASLPANIFDLPKMLYLLNVPFFCLLPSFLSLISYFFCEGVSAVSYLYFGCSLPSIVSGLWCVGCLVGLSNRTEDLMEIGLVHGS